MYVPVFNENFEKFGDGFDPDGLLDSIVPKARSNPTARRGRNHLKVFKNFHGDRDVTVCTFTVHRFKYTHYQRLLAHVLLRRGFSSCIFQQVLVRWSSQETVSSATCWQAAGAAALLLCQNGRTSVYRRPSDELWRFVYYVHYISHQNCGFSPPSSWKTRKTSSWFWRRH